MGRQALNYKNKKLFIEDVGFEKLVEKFGTPLYVYSFSELTKSIKTYKEAFSSCKTLFCYACKANSSLELLNIMRKSGFGTDIVSRGELFVSLKAGVPPDRIVYSGVGKREDEIVDALDANILMFNVESEEELLEINRVALNLNKKARVSFRINPDVDPETHRYISTGLALSKFGIDIKDAEKHYQNAVKLKGIEVVGCQMHIGSQLTKLSPVVEACGKLVDLVKRLREKGVRITYLDLGGGLGITYKNEKVPGPGRLAEKILPLIKQLDVILILEPGRSIVGNSGVLLTEVLYFKNKHNKNFIIIDAGMNDLIRPSLYDAYHEIVPCVINNSKKIRADIVGPVCESGDFLAKDRLIPLVHKNDYLCVRSAGAYGFSMASNYNLRLKPAEVIVNNDKFYLIRERELLDDLLNHQKIAGL
ncbi:MAG: diaminopimelate decarboxylase [bacterium]